MAAKLLFSLICDDAREEVSHKLMLIGLYNYRINVSQPTGLAKLRRPGSPPPKLALPQLCIIQRWFVDSPGQIARTELIEPGKEPRLLRERELPVAEDKYYQEILRIAGFLLSEGEYVIRTSVDGSVRDEPFFVKVN